MFSTDAAAETSDRDGSWTLKRLLVGIDGSDASGAACSFALGLAGKAGAQVLLLHASAELELAEHAAHTAHPERLVAAAEKRLAETSEWQRRLQNLAEYAARDIAVETRILRDRPASALLGAAKEFESDLVLVGSSGVGAVRGKLLGSVSWQVVEHASCSVMVFREEQSTAHVRSVVVGVDGSSGTAVDDSLVPSVWPPLDTRWAARSRSSRKRMRAVRGSGSSTCASGSARRSWSSGLEGWADSKGSCSEVRRAGSSTTPLARFLSLVRVELTDARPAGRWCIDDRRRSP